MSTAIGKYRAKADCRAGGLFRRAGDEFEMPMLKVVPVHLEELGAQGSGKVTPVQDVTSAKKVGGRPAAIPKAAQVGREDVGAGKVTPVQDVTSADMVTK